MRVKEAYRACELFLTFNTRNQTQEAQHAEGQIHLVCPFAFGKSALGKVLFNFLWHPVQRECSSPSVLVCKAAKLAAQEGGSTTHFILLYTRAVCSPAVHCSWLAQKAVDWVSALVIISCKALGLHQHCPPATHIHICALKSHCVPRGKAKRNLSQV